MFLTKTTGESLKLRSILNKTWFPIMHCVFPLRYSFLDIYKPTQEKCRQALESGTPPSEVLVMGVPLSARLVPIFPCIKPILFPNLFLFLSYSYLALLS